MDFPSRRRATFTVMSKAEREAYDFHLEWDAAAPVAA